MQKKFYLINAKTCRVLTDEVFSNVEAATAHAVKLGVPENDKLVFEAPAQ
jgi:hypothetical protein